ncbi:hypothetical protein [Nitrospira lenta]|uniref:PEP-CTERM protein-sorting domain-containing protein n=1 Tax=Nitrospira lenta TaxID=1436998 RepID=A0A330L8N1_9BACT|nr:hypothetical protein [Nitrospira lenta]SPP66216.1 conserved exported hypothetical protein [Nitrospira lenta]
MRQSKSLSMLAIIGASLLTFALPSAPVSAALMQFSFQGDIDTVTGQLKPPLTTAQKLSGSFTIESTTSGTSAGPNTTQYLNIFKSLTLSLGPIGGPAIMTASLGSTDNSLFIKTSGSNTTYSALGPLTGTSVNGRSPISFQFDGKASAPPSIGNLLSSNSWRILFSGNGNQMVAGKFTALTAVPLPAAVVLFGAGLVALAGLGAGSWRQRRNSIAA